jgi:hypothetical protein
VTGFIRIAGDPVDVEFDDFNTLAMVPEPSTFGLAAFGGLTILVGLRRRRSA